MIYLDSAATSLIKPDGVQYAVIEAMRSMASPGRGSHPAAMRASDTCYACRENLSKLFNVPNPEQVVFTFNATHALNIAIHSLVREGTSVLTSGYEHNSVTRPLHALGAKVTRVATPLFDSDAFLDKFRRLLPQADAVVCTHVSNVFGYILPIEKIARLCREQGKPLIIDASQSAGVLDIDFQTLGAEFVAMPGHKGLMGPQGTGVLLCKNEASPLLYGGSGSASRLPDMPDFLPDRLEAGTHNVCGIAGLNASVKYILSRGTPSIRQHERRLLDAMAQALSDRDDLRLFYTADAQRQSGVLSVLPKNMYCEELGDALSDAGVAVRTGLHCAPDAHSSAGTLETGTVRVSFSPFNTAEETQRAAQIIKNILDRHINSGN
jgi:cysteine desulfurase family protein